MTMITYTLFSPDAFEAFHLCRSCGCHSANRLSRQHRGLGVQRRCEFTCTVHSAMESLQRS